MTPTDSSPESPRRSSDAAEESMQVFVKNVSGDTTTLTIPPSTSIATVKSLLTLPAEPSSTGSNRQPPFAGPSSNLRLVFAGRHLDAPDSTLQDYNIPPSATLHLAQPLLGGTADATDSSSTAAASSSSASNTTPATPSKKPATSKKPRCTFKTCNAFAQRVVGDCGFCGGHFCGKHRLLESHACAGLEDCKDEARERNRERLETERTVVVRGV